MAIFTFWLERTIALAIVPLIIYFVFVYFFGKPISKRVIKIYQKALIHSGVIVAAYAWEYATSDLFAQEFQQAPIWVLSYLAIATWVLWFAITYACMYSDSRWKPSSRWKNNTPP